jgi:hypothetical protein
LKIDSFEHLISELQKSLSSYKEKVDSIDMNSGDKKKVLSLPFYLAKRAQLPEPRYGQWEFELFKEMTGKSWYWDKNIKIDEEHKITEFDYENYIDPQCLPEDTDSEDFKQFIRTLSLCSRTEYEAF